MTLFSRLVEAARLVRVDRDASNDSAIEYYSDGTYIERFLSGAYCYYDKDGEFHREDGPAVFFVKGNRRAETWYWYGNEHRTDGPSYINYHERVVLYAINGKRVTRSYFLQHFEDNTRYKDWEVYGDWYGNLNS